MLGMQVWGLTEQQIKHVTEPMDLTIENIRQKGTGLAFKLTPKHALRLGQQYVINGKGTKGARNHVKACCYHEFKAAVLCWFNLGATAVRSQAFIAFEQSRCYKTYHSKADFKAELENYYYANVGSTMQPVEYWQLCADRHSAEGI